MSFDEKNPQIYLVKDGKKQPLKYDTVKSSIHIICKKMEITHLDTDKLASVVYPKLKTKNTIDDIKKLIVACSSEMVTDHYDYASIAMYILITDLHNKTHNNYLDVVRQLRSNVNRKGNLAPIIKEDFAQYVEKHIDVINNALDYKRDYDMSLFGFRTLEKAYLKKTIKGVLIERPQHMWMRVAIALHYRTNCLEKIIETYDLLSKGYFTHATPTLFNAGTIREQLSSCFLLGIADDMDLIGKCWKDCANISKDAGGLSVNISNLRVEGAYINSSQGMASGLRVATVFNQIARYANQGGKRAGSIALYIEPWHGDIFFFLDLKKNTGAETERARDLFFGLMINDLFMERVWKNEKWTLMCPSESDVFGKFGEEFNNAYLKCEAEGKYIRQIDAREVWFKIMETQIETGVPYIIFKDAANYKSNQKNIGVINGSNLCVSGDTLILTSKGYRNIKSLENQEIEIWNGEEFSKTTIKKTGTNQKMLEISFSNGSVLKCTPYHKFYLNCDSGNNKMKEVKAEDLVMNDKLIKTDYPVIEEGSDKFKYPYTSGLFSADGTYSRTKNNKPKQCSFKPTNDVKHDKISVRLYHDIPKKYTVPINCNLRIKLEWLAGLLDGYGTVVINGTNKSLQITSIHKSFLNNVKYMLQTMKCDPKVKLSSEKTSLLPDGRKKMKNCDVKPTFRLLINSIDTYNLIELGLKTHRLDLSNIQQPNRSVSHFIRVKNIKNLEERENTYCFNEKKRHMGIFNGIISGQCSEILEVSTHDEYAVCFTEDTKINTKNGFKTIVNCNNEEVLSCFDNDIDLNFLPHYERAKLIDNGIKTVFKIMTNSGKFIEATKDHPFLVQLENKYQWKKVSELKRGDCLVRYKSISAKKIITTKVVSIIEAGDKHVYDLVLENSHNFVANGHIVHNCNLASICLPKYIKYENSKPIFDHQKLCHDTRIITRNLDNIIDINYYPVIETETSNLKHRPIGIGVQGLADVFIMFKTPFDSDLARDLNKKIFETIYFGAMSESVNLAKERGAYSTFKGSPFSEGKFQFDLWNLDKSQLSGMWNWNELRQEMIEHGTRNSLTTTCMPTASTSQIMNWNETTEAYTQNIYTRTTLAGDFYVVNRHLMKELMELGLWNSDMVDLIKYHKGSIANIADIPDRIKQIYRTVWEIPQKSIIDMATDRAPFIDQTQSMNIFIDVPNYGKLNSCLFHAWRSGLKTGIYYLRSKSATEADNFGIDINTIKKIEEKYGKQIFETTTDKSLDIDNKSLNIENKSLNIENKSLNISTNNNFIFKDNSESEYKMCKRIPGKKLKNGEPCIECSS